MFEHPFDFFFICSTSKSKITQLKYFRFDTTDGHELVVKVVYFLIAFGLFGRSINKYTSYLVVKCDPMIGYPNHLMKDMVFLENNHSCMN